MKSKAMHTLRFTFFLFGSYGLLAANLLQGQINGGHVRTILQIPGFGQDEHFGASIAFAGDLNQDGHGDFAVGSSTAEVTPGNKFGSVFVFSGKDASLLFRLDGDQWNG